MKLVPNVPMAKDALAAVKQGQFARAQEQILVVESAINKAIQAGETSCSGDGLLHESVREAFEAKGYKVTSSSYRNEDTWSVSFQ